MIDELLSRDDVQGEQDREDFKTRTKRTLQRSSQELHAE